MKLHICYLLVCAVLYVNANDQGREKNSFELLLAKLDVITDKQQKLEHQINEHRSNRERELKEVLQAFHNFEDRVSSNLTQHQNRILETIHTVLLKLHQDAGQNQSQPILSSCKSQPTNTSGVYWIRVKSDSAPFKVYCEQQAHGGGWIVFQHRYDGSLDFGRNWKEFRNGFGNLEKEFWLGLEKVHQITKRRGHELIIELKDFNGTYKYARYDEFGIGSEGEQYFVANVGAYSGTAGNEMQHHHGKRFSTKDRDNDEDRHENCAETREGAWWHGDCLDANLNGRYMNDVDRNGMTWFSFSSNWNGLSFSRMMIRELDESFLEE